MRRTFKFRAYPTVRQTVLLDDMLFDHAMLYNGALEERRTAWATTDYAHNTFEKRDGTLGSSRRHVGRGTSVSYNAQSEQLKTIRATDPLGQGRWNASSQQQTLRRLNKAFAAFHKRTKKRT
jgi:putative transposase